MGDPDNQIKENIANASPAIENTGDEDSRWLRTDTDGGLEFWGLTSSSFCSPSLIGIFRNSIAFVSTIVPPS